MTLPYRYVKGAAAGRDETCVLCGSRSTRLVVDHCHGHGYARGLLCGSCNARAAVLDSGAVTPTPKETFYLGNCPECRKVESIDSPHALALRIGSVALAIASALDLSPRQAAALALSLAESESESREPRGLSPSETESATSRSIVIQSRGGPSIAQAVRNAVRSGVTDRSAVLSLVRETFPDASRETVSRAMQRNH